MLFELKEVKFNIFPDLKELSFNFDEDSFTVISGLKYDQQASIIKTLLLQGEIYSGEIWYNGEDISKFNYKQEQNYLSQVNGFYGDTMLINNMTVYENIEMPLKYHKRKDAKERILFVIQALGLDSILDLYPADLSINNRKLTCLARAFIAGDKLIFLSDMSLYLTKDQEKTAYNIIKTLKERYKTCIIQCVDEINKILDDKPLREIVNNRIDFTKQ